MSEAVERSSVVAMAVRSSQTSAGNFTERITSVVMSAMLVAVKVKTNPANTGRRYRAYLTGGSEQAVAVAEVDGCCRVVGRIAIEHHEMRHSIPGSYLTAPSAQLTELRRHVGWLGDAPVHALQQELACVRTAFKNWGKGRGYPTPRRKRDGVRIKFADPKCDWKISHVAGRTWEIRLPKSLGTFRFVKHRPFGGVIKSVTLTGKAGWWHISFGVSTRKPKSTAKTGIVGVDLGVKETVATSQPVDLRDGRGRGPQHLHRMPPLLSDGEQRHLRVLERRAGSQTEARKRRRGKTTRSQQATYRAIARVHARLARRRQAWLRNMAHQLGEYETVVFENLVVPNLTRRPKPKPDPDRPGRFLPNGAAAKTGLNRAVLNSGWGYLRTFTGEKTTVVKVRAAYTSQECRACGHVAKENRPDRDVFKCVKCAHSNHADLNAAENVEARGARVLLDEATASSMAAYSRKADGTKNREARAA